MQLFLSTTFHDNKSTDLDEVLSLIQGLDIDGIELGSTHIYRSDLLNIIEKKWEKYTVTHNFFPPSENPDFVMNIASVDSDVRNQSINHAKYCIEFASEIGASTYTIHPGFMASPDVHNKNKLTYDFNFMGDLVNLKTAFSNMIDSLAQLIDVSLEMKIKLAIETEGSLTKPGVLLMETIEEYDNLFSIFPENIYLNLNLAHTRFASIEHKYKMNDFIKHYYNKIILVEVSHNDGKIDQHQSLNDDSYVFDYLPLLPDVPFILEFRESSLEKIKHSIALMRQFSKKI